VKQAPDQADAWAMLAIMYDTEFAENSIPGPISRARYAAANAP